MQKAALREISLGKQNLMLETTLNHSGRYTIGDVALLTALEVSQHCENKTPVFLSMIRRKEEWDFSLLSLTLT